MCIHVHCCSLLKSAFFGTDFIFRQAVPVEQQDDDLCFHAPLIAAEEILCHQFKSKFQNGVLYWYFSSMNHCTIPKSHACPPRTSGQFVQSKPHRSCGEGGVT